MNHESKQYYGAKQALSPISIATSEEELFSKGLFCSV